MDLTDDGRGQSIQIGAIILFGALIILLSTYQAFVVPDQNREVEFKHSQTVQNDMKDVRGAIISASDGQRSSVSVQLGTEYPARAIFLNPGPPSGSLRTVGTTDVNVNATVKNAEASGDAGDFWDGTTHSYSTGDLIYTPNYNEFQNAPTTVYSNTLLSNRFRSDNLTITDQSLVDGKTITLIALNGSLSRGQSGSVSVDVRPMSASSTTVPIENTAGESVRLELPTTLDNDTWGEVLDDKQYVDSYEVGSPGNGPLNQLNLTLKQGETYTLKLSRVGVGNQIGERPGSSYLVKTRGDGQVVPEGERVTLEVQARDEYNNPVSGSTVRANTSLSSSNVTNVSETDSDGLVELTYEAPTDIDGSAKQEQVNVTLDSVPPAVRSPFNDSKPRNVTFSLSIQNSDLSGVTGGSDSGFATNWLDPSGQTGVSCPDGVNGQCVINGSRAITADLTMETSPTVESATVSYAVNNSTVGTVSPTSDTTNADGQNTTTLTVSENGTIAVFTWSGGSGDGIDFLVENVDSVPTFQSLEAEVTDSRGGGSEATEVTFTYELSESTSGVDLTVVDDLGRTFTTTGSGATGVQQEIVTISQTSGPPTNNFPLNVTADIQGGVCQTATIQNSADTVVLADGDWSECGN